jgi:hypothetical protein
VVSRVALAQEQAAASSWQKRVIEYLERHARSDGGYGWDGQERSHLTPTFAVIGCYKLLGQTPPNKAALAQFVRTHHPMELKKLEQEHRAFDWQQIQSLVWLGEDVSNFQAQVRSWKAPVQYLKQYEQHGWPVFQEEVAAILCRKLVGLPMAELPDAFVDYLKSRRRTNGSFNSAPADSGDGRWPRSSPSSRPVNSKLAGQSAELQSECAAPGRIRRKGFRRCRWLSWSS